MKRLILLLLLAAVLAAAAERYSFRTSEAYARLSAADKQRLEQVHRDLVLLWGALEMFADDHDEDPPATLDELVPKYLAELPSDPFATQQTASEAPAHSYTPSRGGFGYRYKKGAPGNRAWVVRSVGLPDFPYRGERNISLHVVKGTWLSGINPAVSKREATK
jgi:hypothetical protein